MLIEARKNSALETIYSAYARRLIRRQFSSLQISGSPFPATERVVIAYMNHSAWWDAVIPVHLSHDLFRREIHALMEGEQLKKYPFFRHLGCFGPTENSVADARAVVDHATKVLLNAKQPAVFWIFPQGAILPSHVPMEFKSGLSRIAERLPDAAVVPVAIRYPFLKNKKADCRVKIGEPVARTGEGHSQFTRRLEQRLEGELAALDTEIAQELARQP
jgi:1-acyl-sn-glycerol-3-phosphate acyltransferase